MNEKYNIQKKRCIWILIFISLIILIFGCVEKKAELPKIQGYWQGTITLLGEQISIGIQFDISNELSAYIDIPKQGARSVKLEKVKYIFPEISFELPSEPNRIYFNGKYSKNGISGTIKQGTLQGIFMLSSIKKKADDETLLYTNEETSLETGSGIIHGELVMPIKISTFPLAIIISDGSAVDMNGNTIFLPNGHNCLRMLAESLAKLNIASLLYDKRGIGKSMDAFTNTSTLRFDDHIDDLVGWIEQLKKDERFFSVGVIGHGEGSLIGMMGVRKAQGAFFISIEGSGRPVDEVMLEQFKSKLEEDSFVECEYITSELKAGRTVTTMSEELEKYFMPSMQPFLISYFKYNPQQEITRLTVPVLLIHGSTDLIVKKEEVKLLKEVKSDASFIIITGMNHILKPAPSEPSENLKTYRNPTLGISTELVGEVTRFIYNVVKVLIDDAN